MQEIIENCFYCCRLCNGVRAQIPITGADGCRLLNPCAEVWAERLQAVDGDRLQPRPSDPDALYTAFVYDLNDPRKVNLRKARRERIAESLEVLSQGPLLVAVLLEASKRASDREAEAFLAAAVSFERQMVRARSVLERHAAVPQDAVDVCRCGDPSCCTLPAWLEEQTWDLPPESL